MQYSKSDLQNRAKEVVDFVRDSLLDEQGILIMGIAPDGARNNEKIIDDFGDVAPFIALYGGEDMCLTHLKYIEQNLNRLDFPHAFDYTDLIFGLIWYSRIGIHSDLAKELAVKLSELVIKDWFRGNEIRSLKMHGFAMPVTNGIDATYIEVWTEMYRLTNDKKWLDSAIGLYKCFNYLQFSNKKNLIPIHSFAGRYKGLNKLKNYFSFSEGVKFQKVGRLKNSLGFSARILKDNANYGFGLLDLYRLTKDEQVKDSFSALFEGINDVLKKDALPNIIHARSNNTFELLSSFAFLDMTCDAYELFGEEKYIESAKTLADKWIKLQSDTTGLFPKERKLNCSYFDSETDMGVALLKLYTITHENRYLISVERVLEGLLKYHKKQNFSLEVNIEDGSVVNSVIKTKFVALFVKLLHVYQYRDEIYDDDIIFFLSKDR